MKLQYLILTTAILTTLKGEQYTVSRFSLFNSSCFMCTAYQIDVIQTMYQSDDNYQNDDGITFKEQMIKSSSQNKEITICARINFDYFSVKEKYIRIFKFSDGNEEQRVFDFRLRFNEYAIIITS